VPIIEIASLSDWTRHDHVTKTQQKCPWPNHMIIQQSQNLKSASYY